MASFVPETPIICEGCHREFIKYAVINDIVDADGKDELSKGGRSGIINRVVCPFCKKEFTYEIPILIHSYIGKIIALGVSSNAYLNAKDLPYALKAVGSDNWNLRKCSYTMNAAEKIRIFQAELQDWAIEILKLVSFKDYKDMELSDEYITFDCTDGDKLIFSKRNDSDEIIENYVVSKDEYNKILLYEIKIPTCLWQNIDRDWAIKALEDIKC